MKWLFAKRFRSFVAFAAFASLALNLALLTPAVYMMQVFDRVLVSGSVETLVMLSAITLLFIALAWFLDVARTRALAWAGRSLDRALAGPAVDAAIIQAAGPGRADADSLRDIAQLRAFLTGPGVLGLFDAPWLPIYLIFIALMHPVLGVAAAAGACTLIVLGVLTDVLTRASAEETVRDARGAARLAERFARNAQAIVAMGMASAAATRFRDQHERALAAQSRHSYASSSLGAFARALRQVLQVVMLAVGAWLVVDMQASAGVMIAATILLTRALQPVEHLISGWRVMIDARAAWRRLAERAAHAREHDKVNLPAPTGRIAVERLSYAFEAGRPALLRNIAFALEPGESLALIGPSASGKTTLLKLLLGLWRPQTGVVRLDGADIARWDRETLGQHVGYLPQEVELFAGSVGENIARLRDPFDPAVAERIVRAAQLAHAHELILQLPEGYDTHIGEGGAALSGGQRQRLALARALYGEPRLVVLDEPSANLDVAGEAALLAALTELKARGVTVIVTTHNAALMSALDKIAVLRGGLLEMFGPAAAVLARLRAQQEHRVVAFPTAKSS
jgi:PrtD family type I secretion system ABC transporter